MFKCKVCGKEYANESSYHRHLLHSNSLSEEHYAEFMNRLQLRVDKVYNGTVRVINKDDIYVVIYNNVCKHSSRIRLSCLLLGQSCAHKDCVSKTKRKAMKKISNTKEYRENVSKAVKQALKDPVKRMNRLIGQAKVQRNLDSPYEAMFIGVLTKIT